MTDENPQETEWESTLTEVTGPCGAERLCTSPLWLIKPDSAPESKEAEISFRGFSFLIGEKFMKLLKVLILLLKGKVRYVLKLFLHFWWRWLWNIQHWRWPAGSLVQVWRLPVNFIFSFSSGFPEIEPHTILLKKLKRVPSKPPQMYIITVRQKSRAPIVRYSRIYKRHCSVLGQIITCSFFQSIFQVALLKCTIRRLCVENRKIEL